MPTEVASTFRVYERQWVIVRTSASRPDLTYHAEAFAGRLLDSDVRIVAHPLLTARLLRLETRVWVAAGEFVLAADAADFAAEAPERRVVVRNSRDEVELTEYGRKRL